MNMPLICEACLDKLNYAVSKPKKQQKPKKPTGGKKKPTATKNPAIAKKAKKPAQPKTTKNVPTEMFEDDNGDLSI